MWNQFDIVQIVSTKKIRYVSGPKNRAALPDGNWSIVGFKGIEVMIAKHNTIVLVPIADIKKIASYDLRHLFKQLKGYNHDTSK